jgi:hypothetical protein
MDVFSSRDTVIGVVTFSNYMWPFITSVWVSCDGYRGSASWGARGSRRGAWSSSGENAALQAAWSSRRGSWASYTFAAQRDMPLPKARMIKAAPPTTWICNTRWGASHSMEARRSVFAISIHWQKLGVIGILLIAHGGASMAWWGSLVGGTEKVKEDQISSLIHTAVVYSTSLLCN